MDMTENSLTALRTYLNSGNVSEWFASKIISNYGYYFCDMTNEDCYNENIDPSIRLVILCEGDIVESVSEGQKLCNTDTYHFIVDHVISLFHDYEGIMKLVKEENIRVWHDIITA